VSVCLSLRLSVCLSVCLSLLAAPAVDGDYWRLLNPGEYRVMARAEGYYAAARSCHVGLEARATPCDFHLVKTPLMRLKAIRAKAGKTPQELQLRLRALRLRKLRVTTKVLNQRREKLQRQRREGEAAKA